MEGGILKLRCEYKVGPPCWLMWCSALIPAALGVLSPNSPCLPNPFSHHLNWRKLSCPRSCLLLRVSHKEQLIFKGLGFLHQMRTIAIPVPVDQLRPSEGLPTNLISPFAQSCFFSLLSTSMISKALPAKYSKCTFQGRQPWEYSGCCSARALSMNRGRACIYAVTSTSTSIYIYFPVYWTPLIW